MPNKRTEIRIVNISETINPAAIEASTTWLKQQMSAVNIEKCNHLSLSYPVDENTQIEINVFPEPEQAQ